VGIHNTTFGGTEPALIPGSLRAFRSWGCHVTLEESNSLMRTYLNSDRARLNRDHLRLLGWSESDIDNALVEVAYRYGGVVAPGGGSGPPAGPSITRESARLFRAVDGPIPGIEVPETGDVIKRIRLKPVAYSSTHAWSRIMQATCDKSSPPHVAPVADCTCGVYAWYRSEEAIRSHSGFITGCVEVSGRTTLGSQGLRGATGTIQAITLNPKNEHHLPFDRELFMSALRWETRQPGSPYLGVTVYDSLEELTEALPPDLDTVRNLMGDDVVEDLVSGERPAPRRTVASNPGGAINWNLTATPRGERAIDLIHRWYHGGGGKPPRY
jgi:hypothetical protein